MPNYRRAARQAARRYGLNPRIFVRQIGAESGFNPNAVSPKGATGIAQIMPDTARAWGVDPHDPIASLDVAAREMAQAVRKYGGYENALRAYNAGPAKIEASRGYAETNAYVQKILGGANPRQLNTPKGGRAGGTSRAIPINATATGQGQVTTQIDTGSSTAALQALAASLSSQHQAPPQQASLPVPAFAARPVLPAGYQAPQVQAAGQAGVDVASVLASLAQSSQESSVLPVTQRATGTASLSGVAQGPSVSDVQGGGKLLYVGDSLAEGTGQFFKHARVNAKVGRTSTASVQDAQSGLSSGRFGRVLLDFGSNDSSPQELVRSVKRAQRLAPGARIFVPEVRGGPQAAAKTAALRRVKGITVVPWSTPLGADGVHPADYQARAREIRAFVGSGGAGGASTGTGGANLNLRPHGGWGGSEGPLRALVRAAGGDSLPLNSAKRNNTNPYSGKGSDHDFGNKAAYAEDRGNGSQPTPEMDEYAYRLMHLLGFKNYRKGQPINVNQGKRVIDGIQYQVIYRGTGREFGGNHLTHVHLGAHRL